MFCVCDNVFVRVPLCVLYGALCTPEFVSLSLLALLFFKCVGLCFHLRSFLESTSVTLLCLFLFVCGKL